MIGDPLVWKLLQPDCSIEEHSPLQAVTEYRLTPEEKQEQRDLLKQDGYCYIPSLIASAHVEKMAACVRCMVEKRIPPVYCFVYDIFWQLILDIDPILRDFLGEGYLVIPHAWTWVVDGRHPAYFPPHRDLNDEDFLDEQGMPTLFTLWLPLTDVTTFSSCMYLLPASCDPEYPHDALTWRRRWEQSGHKPWRVEDLAHIRALPAPKGSFLGWNAGVMHWGSKPHPKAPARVSIGYYFHAAHAKKKYAGLVDLKQPLTLKKRLSIICAGLHLYGKSLTADAEPASTVGAI